MNRMGIRNFKFTKPKRQTSDQDIAVFAELSPSSTTMGDEFVKCKSCILFHCFSSTVEGRDKLVLLILNML